MWQKNEIKNLPGFHRALTQNQNLMNAIVTVIGEDKVGIIAGVSSVMAENNINILDISQTIMGNYFTMIMMIDISKSSKDMQAIRKLLEKTGEKFDVTINIQHKDVYEAMHRI